MGKYYCAVLGESSCGGEDSWDVFTLVDSLTDSAKWLCITPLHYGSQVSRECLWRARGQGAGLRGCWGRHWLCASMKDNLMTVEEGSGCLKKLSIPAALLRREVKVICPSSKSKDTHTLTPSVLGPTDRWRTSKVSNIPANQPRVASCGKEKWHSFLKWFLYDPRWNATCGMIGKTAK